jgi:hypothetical protein
MERFPSPSFRKSLSASGDAVNTSMLAAELAPLNAQIEQARQKQEVLEDELRVVDVELETFSEDRRRFDALMDVCNALDKLRELKADEIFWEGVAEAQNGGGHVERARSRIASFEGQIRGILEKQASLKEQINHCLDELDSLYEEVGDAYEREERRNEEFAVEREVSSVPGRKLIMPWTEEAESKKRFLRVVLVATLLCVVSGSLIYMIKVPTRDRSVIVAQIPKRLVELIKQEPFTPVRKKEPKRLPEKLARTEPKKVKEEANQQKSEAPPQAAAVPKVADSGGGGTPEAPRKKAEAVGVLAFKDAFKDLMKETPVAKLGTEARLSKENPRVAGKNMPLRSLVSIQAQDGSSGGIGYAGVSRNIGKGNVDRLGGAGIGVGYGGGGYGSGGGRGGGSGKGIGSGQVSSAIANLEKSSRPLSDGVAPGRTDEEIQIVFDRHKAALYRIYNKELRKDPTLRGKILMRLTIEPSGEVSMCKAESTDLASPELVATIVERIKRFNFGPKEGVKRMTILYPIDFLPAG